jgi:gamma-glutamyltranspeptidase/glutathione hydrolase
MLMVAYPHMCGLGGDLFMLYYDAREGRLRCINGSGPAPELATRTAFRERGLEAIPSRGPLTATVPGALAAWDAALARYGSRPFGALLQPAIDAAEGGVEVTERFATWISETREDVSSDPILRRYFIDPDGEPVRAGARVRQPEVAAALRRIAEAGVQDFYRGELASEIDHACRAAGAFLRRADLMRYQPEWVSPLSVSYRGWRVFTTPPNSQGITSLMMLNSLAAQGMEGVPLTSSAFLEAFVTAKKAAFADRDRYITDPAFAHIPVEALLHRDHATQAAGASASPVRNPVGGDTVYFCATDHHGNACSAIQSIYYGFGSCFFAGQSGVLLQNRGHYFQLAPGHPNRLEPGKRTLHTLMACLAFDGQRPGLIFGAMGADGQPQTNVQVLHRLAGGANAEEAVAAPRVLHGRFMLEDDENVLQIEQDLGDDAIAALRAGGYELELTASQDQRMGHAQAIAIGEDGSLSAGSDPRSDGMSALVP